jgi:hypothetical protein
MRWRSIAVAALGAIGLSGCERADMTICKAMPAAEQVDVKAWRNPDPTPVWVRSYDQETVVPAEEMHRAAQGETIRTCLRRAAYLLARSGASNAEIAKAATARCEDVMVKEFFALDQNGPLATLALKGWDREAVNLVVEAKAGRCWAQGPWWRGGRIAD